MPNNADEFGARKRFRGKKSSSIVIGTGFEVDGGDNGKRESVQLTAANVLARPRRELRSARAAGAAAPRRGGRSFAVGRASCTYAPSTLRLANNYFFCLL
jgi:hypothetical protein